MEAYLVAKWIHILCSTVLFGTGIGTAFQVVWAMRTGKVETIHSVASGVVIADWIFTTPAGIVQPLSGVWLVWLQGYSLSEPWLLVTYVLYVVAFCAWLPVVGLQIRIRNLAAKALKDGQPLPAAARNAYGLWFALGWPAFTALIAVYWLMIAKPTFGA
jgi:uncharacterized membrane protein